MTFRLIPIAAGACTAVAVLCLPCFEVHALQGPVQAVPGEIIVRLKETTDGLRTSELQGFSEVTGARRLALRGELARFSAVTVEPLLTDRRYAKIAGGAGIGTNQLLQRAAFSPNIKYAEPNYIYTASQDNRLPDSAVIPNDPNLPRSWGLLNVGQKDEGNQAGNPGSDIKATQAWVKTTGSPSILVAVIDSGIDYTHDDLKENIFVNRDEVAGNGIDDDGNGFVDDIHGWNFSGKSNDPMDDSGHGTHVAGIIGARGNNNVGTAGVAWQTSLLPIKFLDASGNGTLENAIASIHYAIAMKAKVINTSWNGGFYSRALHEAIMDARDHGILLVASAGNYGTDNDVIGSFPATYDVENIISVAATDNQDALPFWSDFGHSTVHLAAPGVQIFSTIPPNSTKHHTLSGTSMACPFVSGAAALVWAANENLTWREVKGRLLQSVDKVPSLRGKVVSEGRLNVYGAVMGNTPETSTRDK